MKRGQAKRKRSSKTRDRPKKKALSGPRRPAKKPRAKRRGIVAASRRLDRRVDSLLRGAEAPIVRSAHRARLAWARWSRRLLRWGRPLYAGAGRVAGWIGRRLRPLGVLSLRLLGFGERRARALAARSARAATRASCVLTPERGICLTIVASAGCLLAAQFVDYRGIEVGQPGYAGLPEFARAPTEGLQSPVDAHSYALFPVALAVIVLALVVARGGNRRLGRVVFALGLASALVVLLVDRPAGLDLGEQAARFAGAHAVLTDDFYAQLASAAGMMLGGLLLLYAPQKRRVRSKRAKTRPVPVNAQAEDAKRTGRKRRPRAPRAAQS